MDERTPRTVTEEPGTLSRKGATQGDKAILKGPEGAEKGAIDTTQGQRGQQHDNYDDNGAEASPGCEPEGGGDSEPLECGEKLKPRKEVEH